MTCQFLIGPQNSLRENKLHHGNVPDPSPPSTQMTVGWGMVWLARLVLRSINGRISQELVSVQYTCIDHLVSLVLLTGRGLALVKADIKEAYHNIPVHPDDHHLLAVQWEGMAYVDRVLPFGLRSVPLIFSAAADAAQQMLQEKGVTRSLHYLDDFALVEHNYERTMDVKGKMCELFQFLLKGPSASLTFLGIQVDTLQMQLCLPADKLERLPLSER